MRATRPVDFRKSIEGLVALAGASGIYDRHVSYYEITVEKDRIMSWENYTCVRQAFDSGEHETALELLRKLQPYPDEFVSPFSCLEAQCFDRMGKSDIAISKLRDVVAKGLDDEWVNFSLGSIEGRIGQIQASSRSFQRAHAKWGWPESGANNYLFTHDFFSPNIPNWTKWFLQHIKNSPIDCLEIGSWQGGSATWLLDNIVSKRGGSITCIDTFEGSSEHATWIGGAAWSIEDIFDHNINATGLRKHVHKLKGYSQEVLMSLHGKKFDFVYIDGAHEASAVLQDAVLCWRLLNKDGHMLFDDVDFQYPDNPQRDTSVAIDAFLRIMAEDINVIHKERQLLVQKM